jgi:hypothetical protein
MKLAMKLLSKCWSRRRVFIFAAAFGLGLVAAVKFVGLAQAFTVDDQSNTNSDGSARFSDPDERFSGSSNAGATTYRSGNTTMQFGPQRSLSDQRYNTDRMFDPNGRPGDDR